MSLHGKPQPEGKAEISLIPPPDFTVRKTKRLSGPAGHCWFLRPYSAFKESGAAQGAAVSPWFSLRPLSREESPRVPLPAPALLAAPSPCLSITHLCIPGGEQNASWINCGSLTTSKSLCESVTILLLEFILRK